MQSYTLWRHTLLLLSLLLGSTLVHAKNEPAKSKQSFRIHGSNTIGEKFAPDLIKAFLREKGYFLAQIESNDLKTATPELERLISTSS